MILQFSNLLKKLKFNLKGQRTMISKINEAKIVESAASYSVDTRNTIGKLYQAWTSGGKKPSDFEDLLGSAGYKVTRQSLNNWRRAIVKNTVPISHSKNCGRKPLLTQELLRAFIGRILEENEKGKIVSSQTAAQLAKEVTGIQMSAESARLLLRKNGISSRLCRRSSTGFEVDNNKLGKMYTKWLRQIGETGILQRNPCLIGSLDFAYTRQTTTRWRTNVPRGRLKKLHFSMTLEN